MYIQRDELLSDLIKYRGKDIVKIVTGIRRCGKSVLLNELYYDYLIRDGVPADHIIRIALDLKKWEALQDSDRLYAYVKGLITDGEVYYIFIDEIQLMTGFETVVNSLKAEFNTDIYITGSNSKLLSNEINTVFRGRGIEIRAYPLSFEEFYRWRNIDKADAFDEYVLFGGMPFTVLSEDGDSKRRYLDMLVNTVMTRDIIERYNIRNREMFVAIAELLCSSVGSYISTNKIANTLRSNGYTTADNETVGKYLDYLCDAFLFYRVKRYDVKGKEYLRTQNKFYVTDIGLRNAVLHYRQIEMTHIIENIVYIELLRRGYVVDIGLNREKEIDFVANALDGDRYYIQVSYSVADPDTMARELSAFQRLDDGFRKVLITMDRNPQHILENGYRRLQLFDFLLNRCALEEC